MLGAIIGDIAGSIYEFNNHRSKQFAFFGPGADFTDDTVHAIWLAQQCTSAPDIRAVIAAAYHYDLQRDVDGIRATYRFNETCQQTVPEALICALEAHSFEDAIRNAISIGGDSDTVAAIAGGLAEALFGIPDELAEAGLARLPADMRDVIKNMYRAADKVLP